MAPPEPRRRSLAAHPRDPASLGSRPRAGALGADASYLPARGRLRSWNRVTPLRAGREAFPAMLAAIAAARRQICLETYILRADRVGMRFQAALMERARAGVAVRLLFDAVGSFGLPAAYLATLARAGVEWIEFRPIAPWRKRFGWHRRDHKKLLVVDGQIAITGGLNIGDEYGPPEDHGGGWHDMAALVEGPAVRELMQIFASTWEAEGGSPIPRETRADEASAAPGRALAFVQVIASLGAIRRPGMRNAYLQAIRRAKRRVSVMNAYFIPDAALRRAFANAVRRGVSVSVIVPAHSDSGPAHYAGRNLYARLLRSGVRIHEWQGPMMHAKSAAIDGIWSTIGSYNLDRRSFVHDLQVGLLMIDRELARELEAQFDEDLAGCREVTAREWSERPRWQKLRERFWYLLRYWL